MKNTPKLTKRMTAAADFVRQGSYIADIGTDHGYIPIALMLGGRIRGAVASDINEGPLIRAEANLRKFALSGRITLKLANGLEGIEKFSPDDILILGMGGELIAEIISRAEFVKIGDIRLILQPMTHPEILRAFLTENGFSIVDEAIVSEDKIYQIIVARFSGSAETLSPFELHFGRINKERGGEEFAALLLRQREILEARKRGRMSSADSQSHPEEQELLEQIEENLRKFEKN